MGFKEDADFARYLSMGVYAADAITQDLQQQHHHDIIELERYAKANKVWQTKVKRMRLPDLMCIKCGRRFEAKGKTKLEVKLSDSTAPGRAWRDGGMRRNDVFAFARVDTTANPATVSNLVYVTRQALEDALPSSKEGVRKAISEGSEGHRTWPMWSPGYSGRVTELIVSDTKRSVHVTNGDMPQRPYWHGKNWRTFHSLAVGDTFEAGQPVASSFSLANSIECTDTDWDWKADLASVDDDTRFPAVKAARFLGAKTVEATLLAIARDDNNDWRTRLEAHASLAPLRPASVEELRQLANQQHSSEEMRMEAVFALSEIATEAAANALLAVACSASPVIPEEVRAAAAWGLGTGAYPSPAMLVLLLNDPSILVATHAAAVLPMELPPDIVDELGTWLMKDDPRSVATAAHLLAERGLVAELVNALEQTPDSVRKLVVLALGDASREAVENLLDFLDDPSRAGVETLWAKKEDWLRQPDTDGIFDALHQQMLRR